MFLADNAMLLQSQFVFSTQYTADKGDLLSSVEVFFAIQQWI